ncbi:caspase family protein [Microcoleus sp. FACHB-672]|uniref:caspase family protein n=1 Tax=Microcoleus sp. FACHB-672 TaxID=2692825 RepID=UPI001684FF38|nr:caspase family protein [Microcoleus sp. FACHB-672]MBD2042957.1 caspase family protein [Microcoleus sp. FACHB-672]
MGLKRREFLQRAGSLLAGLGMSEALLGRMGDRYYQALAQPNARKLALLVGINQYGSGNTLNGCVTDVDLQRELLIHRFGFQPADVLTITDSLATRNNIENAFVSHLKEQAGADDVVVFHFSGYGRRIHAGGESESAQDSTAKLQNSLVPVDGILGSDTTLVNDLLEETLLLLIRSLQTESVLAVLDTSYTYPGTGLQGNLRIRSRPTPMADATDSEELNFQQQLREGITQKRSSGLPGVILTAAAPDRQAAEMQWNGFSAGLFTYALTQSLWWATPATTLNFNLQRAACTLKQLAGKDQQPQILHETGKKNTLPVPVSPVGADGAVISVGDDGKTVQVWLAGLPARVLESYGVNSLLRIVPQEPAADENASLLQIRSRSGLTAQAQLLSANGLAATPLKVGQFVQEAVRVLPRNITLTVALEAGLDRIERVDATSAFSTISHVSPVVAGEQPADCLFGRVRETLLAQTPTAALPTLAQGSYGLFSLAQDLIPNTIGEGGEAVKAAVRRLTPQLQTLLAAKLWRLTANEGSSRLGITATLEQVEGTEQRVQLERKTLREQSNKRTARAAHQDADLGVLNLSAGSRIQYRLRNDSDRPVYYILLGLDHRGRAYAGGVCEAVALCAVQPAGTTEVAQTETSVQQNAIAPGESVTIPSAASQSVWIVRGTRGVTEAQVICSTSPFTRTSAALAAAMPSRGDAQPIGVLSDPLPVAQALLQDLHQASAGSAQLAGISSDAFAFDVNAWATLSFIYQVV